MPSPSKTKKGRLSMNLSKLTVDDIVESFDDIPQMMNSLCASRASPSKYHCKEKLFCIITAYLMSNIF